MSGKQLNVLANRWHNCTRCDLHKTRLTEEIFFGSGNPRATYLFVAGAPRAEDEEHSSVFAGHAAGLLLQSIETIGIDLNDCYFTYAVSCRPKVFIPATDTEGERIEDRAPSREELTACRPRINEVLYQVDPRIVFTLGEWATKTLVRGRLPKFLDAVGKQYVCLLPAATREDHADGKLEGRARYHDIRYPILTLPDPASILINTSTAQHGPHAVLLRTLERGRQLAEFVINAEKATMETK